MVNNTSYFIVSELTILYIYISAFHVILRAPRTWKTSLSVFSNTKVLTRSMEKIIWPLPHSRKWQEFSQLSKLLSFRRRSQRNDRIILLYFLHCRLIVQRQISFPCFTQKTSNLIFFSQKMNKGELFMNLNLVFSCISFNGFVYNVYLVTAPSIVI